jgi:hypothetical protein
VVAADPAIRYGDIVAQGHKLANYYGQQSKYDIVIGGAGDGVYVDMASQKIRDAVAGLPSPVLPTIKAEYKNLCSQFTMNTSLSSGSLKTQTAPRWLLSLLSKINNGNGHYCTAIEMQLPKPMNMRSLGQVPS